MEVLLLKVVHKDGFYIKIIYFHLLIPEFSTFHYYYTLLIFQNLVRKKNKSPHLKNGYDVIFHVKEYCGPNTLLPLF